MAGETESLFTEEREKERGKVGRECWSVCRERPRIVGCGGYKKDTMMI